jgi:hypothetical protein
MRTSLIFGLVFLVALGISCGDSSGPGSSSPPENPVPGWLKVRLSTPNADDAGIMFTVSGAKVNSVRSTHPDLFTHSIDSTHVRVIVAGNLVTGTTIAELQVPDVEIVASYSLRVEELAAAGTWAQRPTSSVTLTVER